MKEQHGLRVQEDGVNVFVGAGRILGGRGHLEWSEEAGDEDLQLLHVLLLSLDHAEDQASGGKVILCFLFVGSHHPWERIYLVLFSPTSFFFSCSQRGETLCSFPQFVSNVV